MAFDAHKNFAITTVVTAPSPATSGTTLVVTSGEGARFPTTPFNATVWPAGQIPTPGTAEVVRVTSRTSDTLTITRAQESSTARSIITGDYIAATISTKTITDLEAGTNFPQISTGSGVFTPDVSIGQGGTASGNSTLTMNGTSATATGSVVSLLANGALVGYVAREAAVAGGTSNALSVVGSSADGLSLISQHATAPIRFHLGTSSPERGRIYPSGGISWGTVTDPGVGRAIFSGGVTSATGTSVSTASGVWVTLFTISNSASTIGLYLVQAGLGVNDATNYGAYGIIVIDGTAARIVASNATTMELQLSGLNVQAKQASGASQLIQWNALRIQ